MKKKKLQLNELKVKSQFTNLNEEEANEIKGGGLFNNNNNNVVPSFGRKFRWTVTEQRGEVRIRKIFEGKKECE